MRWGHSPRLRRRHHHPCPEGHGGHRRPATDYINTAIIPMLCRKAGVPTTDIRGNITSHGTGPIGGRLA